VKGKAGQKTFLTTLCLDGLVTLMGKLADQFFNALIIEPDFTRDKDYLSLFGTSVIMWLTLNEDYLSL
jgi:hypothetical protein